MRFIVRGQSMRCGQEGGGRLQQPETAAAFTVLEALLTVIVLAVLASFAIPGFLKTTEQAKDKEAQAVLEQIRAAEAFYQARFNAYYPNAGVVTDVDTINLNLRLQIDPERNWDYSVEALGSADFRALATRLSPPPGYARSWEVTKNTSTF